MALSKSQETKERLTFVAIDTPSGPPQAFVAWQLVFATGNRQGESTKTLTDDALIIVFDRDCFFTSCLPRAQRIHSYREEHKKGQERLKVVDFLRMLRLMKRTVKQLTIITPD